MAKLFIDEFTGTDTPFLRRKSKNWIFYNDANTGKTSGYIIPLLYLYSLPSSCEKLTKTDKAYKPDGRALIVCSNTNDCKAIGSFMANLNPLLNCFVLQNDAECDYVNSKDAKNRSGQFYKNYIVRSLLDLNILSNDVSCDIIVTSLKRLERILGSKTNSISPQVLSSISFLIFDDFVPPKIDENGMDPFSELLNRTRKAKVQYSMASTDLYIACITSSLDDKFISYSKRFLSDFWLYDFKFGSSQRLVGGKRTDVLKLEIDLDEAANIQNVESGNLTNCSESMEHCICKVPGVNNSSNRIDVLKGLVYCYLDLPLFTCEPALYPIVKQPPAKHKCVIFVSNWNQKQRLVSSQYFQNVSVYLGRELDVFERANALTNFKNGTRPIMIATDASVYACNFDDVRYIFNLYPPRSFEAYKSRAAIAAKNPNSICITLYDNQEYASLCSMIKKLDKPVTVHLVPSEKYLQKHDLKWVGKITSELLKSCKSTINSYIPKSEELLERYGPGIVSLCLRMLVGNAQTTFTQDDEDSCILYSKSILTGKAGFTAITLVDPSQQTFKEPEDIKRILSEHNAIGKICKTERGFIFDISNRHLSKLGNISHDFPDVSIEMSTHIPQLFVSKEPKFSKHRVSISKLPWHSLKMRRLPLAKKRVIF
ncbi:bifunctional P-loop containing nucleoside triphosphate hydrolase/Helicase [Babesia duncani]|uniref:Bifunctional P-loop containing nucleoside triphosphate hydrolase/Helicase n=1 Tax=Babesia duncani TaxID=323732 RepID=A0AAD9UQ73_9APIC|nr:bifunctional P-loop containing nucleoside triphosphate hydrolase/Helicase [Babesia duncani]